MTIDPFPFPLKTGIYDTSPKMARLYLSSGETSDGLPEFIYDTKRDRYFLLKLQNLQRNLNRYRVAVPSLEQNSLDVAHGIFSLFAEKCPRECVITANDVHFFATEISLNLISGEISLSNTARDTAKAMCGYLNSVPMPMRLFDAFALHVQEDFAITARNLDLLPPNDYLELAHICFPSHWDPRHKIGKNFSDIHRPVANNQKLLKAHHTLINSMFERGPFARFVWGISWSDDLDRHPERIREQNEKLPNVDEQLLDNTYLRVERQVTYPLLSIERSFFTIRVFLKSLREVAANDEHRILLRDALLSMNDEALRYKGLVDYRDHLVSALGQ